eukprot:424418_1
MALFMQRNFKMHFCLNRLTRHSQQMLITPPLFSFMRSINYRLGYNIEWTNIEVRSEFRKSEQKRSDQVKMEQHQHTGEDKLDETQIVHEYLNPFNLLASSGVALPAAAKIAAMAGSSVSIAPLAVGGAGAVVFGFHSLGTYFSNELEAKLFAEKKSHNKTVDLYNEKLEKLKNLERIIQPKVNELITQEKLNTTVFQFERHYHLHSKAVVCVGPTGYGKSLVCDRLIGDTRSVEELEDSH